MTEPALMRPLTAAERAAVVAEAKSWLGTPWHHMADVKGAGVDCGMLLVRIYTDLGLAPKFDPRPYAQQWFLHQDEERYLAWVKKYCVQVEREETAAGDIQLYQFGRTKSHGAIVVDDELMIHAYFQAEQVEIRERRAPLVRGHIDSYWSPRVPK
jgi:NlpC/P60 family putative phage cell wall peptidase